MTRMRAALLLVALVVAGCSDDDDDDAATTTSTSTSTTTSTTAPTTSTTAAPLRAQGDTGSGDFSFRSPSNNIFCAIDSGEARCDITEKTWSPPPKPADCELDWGGAVSVTAGSAGFMCAGDSVQEEGAPVLPYGGVVTRGDIRCRSEESGMTCEHVPSGKRFMLSRERYELR